MRRRVLRASIPFRRFIRLITRTPEDDIVADFCGLFAILSMVAFFSICASEYVQHIRYVPQ